jgi:SPP1 gp7 family putative phage head morphogenesis protein
MAYDLDAIIRRQLYLQRYATGYGSDILDLLSSGDKKIISAIRDFFDGASEKDITALLKNNKSNESVKLFIASLTDIVRTQQLAVAGHALTEMQALAESEINYTYAALGSTAVSKPSVREIMKLPILGSSNIETSWGAINSAHLLNVVNSVKNAAQDNLDPVQVVRGTKVANYKDGVTNKRNNNILSLANTQAVGISSNARSESYKKFQFTEVVVSATLDFRTTPICQARDGNVYKKVDAPKPPYHYRCRTLLLPWTGRQEERPYVETAKPIAKLTKKEREDLGYGTTTDNYQQFFDRQTEEHKIEILGEERYKRYKEKNWTLDKFVDERTGHRYTLAELDAL